MEKLLAAINIYSNEAKSPSGRVLEELFPNQPMAHGGRPAWCKVNLGWDLNVALLSKITERSQRSETLLWETWGGQTGKFP